MIADNFSLFKSYLIGLNVSCPIPYYSQIISKIWPLVLKTFCRVYLYGVTMMEVFDNHILILS